MRVYKSQNLVSTVDLESLGEEIEILTFFLNQNFLKHERVCLLLKCAYRIIPNLGSSKTGPLFSVAHFNKMEDLILFRSYRIPLNYS